MTSRPPRPQRPQVRREMLANWLALLTLLALGVVWPGEESAGVAAQGAGSAAQSAPSAAQSRRVQASAASYAMR